MGDGNIICPWTLGLKTGLNTVSYWDCYKLKPVLAVWVVVSKFRNSAFLEFRVTTNMNPNIFRRARISTRINDLIMFIWCWAAPNNLSWTKNESHFNAKRPWLWTQYQKSNPAVEWPVPSTEDRNIEFFETAWPGKVSDLDIVSWNGKAF